MRTSNYTYYTASKNGDNNKKSRVITELPYDDVMLFGDGEPDDDTGAAIELNEIVVTASQTDPTKVTTEVIENGGADGKPSDDMPKDPSTDKNDDIDKNNKQLSDLSWKPQPAYNDTDIDLMRMAMPWDPRVARNHSVFIQDKSGSMVLYPFASNTVATCYQDMVFHIPKHIGDFIEKAWANGYKVDYSSDNLFDPAGTNNTSTSDASTGSKSSQQKKPQADTEQDKILQSYIDELKKNMKRQDAGLVREHPYGDELYRQNPDMLGAQSIMNPYSITRLTGAFDRGLWKNNDDGREEYVSISGSSNHLFDIRHSRRFYDTNTLYTSTSESYPTDVTCPTTTNIIKWSNQDRWGRTPYTFQDFVFSKWWNIIPNNRLVTLRKYQVPVVDNLNFPGMLENIGEDAGYENSYDHLLLSGKDPKMTATSAQTGLIETFPPICTLVGYLGDETGNKISELLSFSAGVNWEEIKSEMHNVTGNEGSDPREVIDNWSTRDRSFFGADLDYGKGLLNSLTAGGGFATSKYIGVNKFVSMFTPGGFKDVSKTSLEKLKAAQMDPQADGPYNNRIEGPLNRIDKIWKRKEGISFGHSIKLKFDYVARPIGGMNTKAVMLDILANCLMMGASDAVFWGGGHRFNIEYANHYCYSGFNEGNDFMMKLYKGKIFGNNGAIASALTGIKNIGTGKYGGGGTGSFSFDNVMSLLGDTFKSVLGGLGSVLNSAVSMIFGEGGISNAVRGAVDTVNGVAHVSDSNIKRGKGWLESLSNNLESLWQSKMLQATTFPSIKGFKAILTGEPVGPWHVTVGNPLNPMMVIGNLICKNVKISFSDELGPDDFPLEMSATYELEHGMIRDKAAIESMFNRGSGKIYKLPDFVSSVSDFETEVDKYTGGTDFRKPHYADTPSSKIYAMAGASGGYSIKNYDNDHTSDNSKDSTTIITKFTPYHPSYNQTNRMDYNRNGFVVSSLISNYGLVPLIKSNILQNKSVK